MSRRSGAPHKYSAIDTPEALNAEGFKDHFSNSQKRGEGKKTDWVLYGILVTVVFIVGVAIFLSKVHSSSSRGVHPSVSCFEFQFISCLLADFIFHEPFLEEL
jgi:hypothetical protein